MPRQLRIKNLKEKRGAIIQEMNAANEERNFELFNEKDAELKAIENEIKGEERLLTLETETNEANNPADDQNQNEDRNFDLANEIRSLKANTELNISDVEIEARDGEFVVGGATGQQTSTGNIAKMTFANYIIQKLPYISPLYARMRKEPLNGKTHAIPVQKKKLPKFVRMKELQEYSKTQASYEQIKMEAVKYGTLVVISEECVQDTGYDIVGDIKAQILEGYALTLDELMIKGDPEEGVEGLISLDSETDGSHEVAQETLGAITIDEIEKIYYAVPKQYRKNGTWIFSDDTARLMNGLKYSDGKPLLKEGYNGKPFGEDSTLMGCPVIISNEMANLNETDSKAIVFGDLSKGFIVAPRKSLTVQKSTEFGWIEDSIAYKANVRLDIKKALTETMAYYKTKDAGRSKTK
ncbi:phage major capsid protein [Clostridium saudiense]|uniref:phage major capsid protein n=1 Tax=Clostridium saudiense TaxID=1414720 RepID=UPI0018AB8771|nr:phage major capsid protein [Clostridium saudiense]DAN20607.1 MAG TPA: major capsid protein [Caudoviricetes sp.]